MTVKKLLEKYKDIATRSEYINIQEILIDLNSILREQRLRRIPKEDR